MSALELDLRAHRRLDPELRDIDVRLQEWGLAKPQAPEHAQLEHEIARLSIRHAAAIMAHYRNLSLPADQRARLYLDLVRTLLAARLQSQARVRRVHSIPSGPGTYRVDLDRARTTLAFALAEPTPAARPPGAKPPDMRG